MIRRALGTDAAAITALFGRCFTETFGHLYSADNLAAFLAGNTVERWAGELADPAFALWVAEADGDLVGYAKLGPPSLPFEPTGVPIELRSIYVLAGWHGLGVAPALMDLVIAEARRRGADELFLSVFVDNARARRFYERYGFTRVGTYAFIVGTHEDEDDVMRLAL